MEDGTNKEDHPLNNQRLTNTLILAVILLLAIVLVVRYHYDHNSSNPPRGTTQSGQSATTACSLFTLSDAKSLIGSSATMRSVGPVGKVNTSGQTITDCYYSTASSNPAITSYQTASLEVILAKNHAGVIANQNEYNTAQKLGPTTEISGLGDKAYYVPTSGQLEVLKGNFYLVSVVGNVGPGGLAHDESSVKNIIGTALTRL